MVRCGDDTLNFMSLNLSCGGIRLETNRPLQVGMRVSLEFDTPAGPVQVQDAEVIWSKPFEPISIDGVLPGMGLRFHDLTVRDARHLSQAVEQRIVDAQLAGDDDVADPAVAFASELAQELSIHPVSEPKPEPEAEPEPDEPEPIDVQVPDLATDSEDSKVELWRPPELESQPHWTADPIHALELEAPASRHSPARRTRPLHLVAAVGALLSAVGVVGYWVGRPRPAPPAVARVSPQALVSPTPVPTVEAQPTPTATRVALATPAPTPETASNLVIGVPTTSPKYKYFALPDPPRIVVDVYDIEDPPSLPTPGWPVTNVRSGRHPDRYRVVLDVRGDDVPSYEVVATTAGLEVRIAP